VQKTRLRSWLKLKKLPQLLLPLQRLKKQSLKKPLRLKKLLLKHLLPKKLLLLKKHPQLKKPAKKRLRVDPWLKRPSRLRPLPVRMA
jgi:hypothetical protein